ncbi:hypothetical protein BAE44_0021271 [Dichanthelium oligosanthes]|uniref:F-box/LRR-repeat protein 15/At3g58940/PEG3-like LRR domain-containing protein n=1 Tax=Dichanthelium oligosanthes TaxID=888268 RepID=A0A1E5UXW5_9POAL|nr:hypothetical protein BAE44_0021271 [Dichanthelium oligosanthes]
MRGDCGGGVAMENWGGNPPGSDLEQEGIGVSPRLWLERSLGTKLHVAHEPTPLLLVSALMEAIRGIILQEVVIMEAPYLQRMLTFPPKGPTTIKEMIAMGLAATICTVKVLVIMSASPNLGAVLRLLNLFPCLEKMYIVFSLPRINMGDSWQHYALEPIQC